ncbi:hypothetical protein [Chlamydiifrater volucris]|uniref:hypothetical protein n=1 Tax=Chlamydiifrater volucris TaxID=2681470 RepID=UPI001BCB3E87|nr:hypothetical protein [Chlamydiifrater volucris]
MKKKYGQWVFMGALGASLSLSNLSSASSELVEGGGYNGGIGTPSSWNPTDLIVHDRVIMKVNEERVLTVLDVIHKLNVIFYSAYPNLADSLPARSQFYEKMWPSVLELAVDEFLMCEDAHAKKIHVDRTMVKEEIEEMFGGDLTPFAIHFDMTPEHVFSVVHRSLVSQRMVSMMIRSKALLQVTPSMVRDYYLKLAEEAANTLVWKYRVLTVKAANESQAEKIAQKVVDRINETRSIDKERLSALVLSQGGRLTLSEEFSRSSKELSAAHEKILVAVPEGAICGAPVPHRDGACKVFAKLDVSAAKIAPISELENGIKSTLVREKYLCIEKNYKDKLRSRYGYDPKEIAKLFNAEASSLFSLL